MTVNTLTLYMPGSSVGIQVYEGSQLHLILVSQGANSVPSAPGETVRQDPFPQYVDDDELASALAGFGGGGGAVASVNGQTGVVTLTFSDVGAVADTDPRLSDARPPTAHTHTASQVSDSTTVGRAVLTAADATAARTAIGAGTSSLAIGTTGTTAKAGNYQPAAANISDSTATGRSLVTATDAAAARSLLTVPLGTGVTEIRVLTQAAYDGIITKSATTLYVIQG